MATTQDYIPISELPSLDGAIPAGDELLIMSQKVNGSDNNYISYKVSIQEIEPCISSDIFSSMKSAILADTKNLIYADKDDLEYSVFRHIPRPYELTSFAVRALSNNSNIGAKVKAQVEEGKLYAISAVSWNDNLTLTATEDIELTQLSDAAFDKVLKTLDNLGIRNGVSVITPEDDSGLSLAQIKLKDNDWCTIYSGDPSKLVSISTLTTSLPSNAGERAIARINFGGTNKSVTLSNALSVNAVPASYDPSVGSTGEVIGYINSVALKNNLSIAAGNDTSNMEDMPYGQYGDNIARINGKYIKNGLRLTNVDNTAGSRVIVNINGTDVHNGIAITDIATAGNKICRIDGKDLYNNITVHDRTGENGKFGDCIAQINDVSVYNGVVITVDEEHNQTYINGRPTKGGIRLGAVTPKTDVGDLVAEIETATGIVQIYNGINTNSLSSDIVSKLEAEIEMLRERRESDMEWMRNELKKYVLLNSSATQTLTGPVKFVQTIDGNITNANLAVRAKWA